jgi:hypothetical protein
MLIKVKNPVRLPRGEIPAAGANPGKENDIYAQTNSKLSVLPIIKRSKVMNTRTYSKPSVLRTFKGVK